MNKSIIILPLSIFMTLLVYADGNTPNSKANLKTAYSLTVKVAQLRNSKGVVQFSLYNKNGTVPDEKFTKYFKQMTGKIKNGASVVTFSNLPAGRYAVNILHDENQNKRIDKGFMLPIEGVGFTNYQSIGLTNRPNFTKASFDLKTNTVKAIKIIYF